MPTLWETNLAALQDRYADLAGEARDQDPCVRLFPSRAGPLTGEVLGTGDPVLLHSRYDPAKEAKREADAVLNGGGVVVILLGMGLGYIVQELVERQRDLFFDLLVVERDPGVFRAALEAVPLAAAFRDQRVHFVVGDRLPLAKEVVRKLLPGIMSSRLQVFRRRALVSLHSEYYNQVSYEIDHLVEHTTAEFQLMLQSGPRLQENLWRNLPQMVAQAGVLQVKDLLEDTPAFVVAAGPSLNKNLASLSKVGESGVIICVDTAYRLLERERIAPHLVVTTDPTELNERHFQDLSFRGDPILAFDPEVYHTIPARVPWRRLIINLDKCATTRWFEDRFGPWGSLEKGGSVANTAFSLARLLGCRPIIFVGLDLAYDPQGGKSHADGTALARPFDSIEQGVSLVSMGRHAATEKPLEENIVWVPGVTGGEAPTSRIMALYIRKFEEEIAGSDRRVIDSTEGGALIRGTENLPLAQSVSTFCTVDRAVRQRLAESLALEKRISRDQVSKEVAVVSQRLQEATEQARMGLRIVENLQPHLDRGSRLRDDPLWIQMEETFNRIYRDPLVKAGVEQALFSAIYHFCQKEPDDAVGKRLDKYRMFFDQCAVTCDAFSRLLAALFS